MSASNTDSNEVPEAPQELKERIELGKCILFAGAGISIAAGFGTWQHLLIQLFNEVTRRSPSEHARKAEFDDLLNKGEFLAVADYCRKRLGRGDFATVMARFFHHHPQQNSTWHSALSRIPFSGAVTTNYDRLIEMYWMRHTVIRADERTQLLRGIEVWRQTQASGEFPILKLHGTCEAPHSLILTTVDYRSIIFRNEPLRYFMRELLRDHTLLFIGFSFKDPNIENLFHWLFTLQEGDVSSHYALVANAGEIWREFLYDNYSVRVISYPTRGGNHDLGLRFIERLGPYQLAQSDIEALERLKNEYLGISIDKWERQYYVEHKEAPRVAYSRKTGEVEIAWVAAHFHMRLYGESLRLHGEPREIEYGFIAFIDGRFQIAPFSSYPEGTPLSQYNLEKTRASIALWNPTLV